MVNGISLSGESNLELCPGINCAYIGDLNFLHFCAHFVLFVPYVTYF